MKSSLLVAASFALAIAMGSLISRTLFPLLPSEHFGAGAVPGLIIVGFFLLFSGCVYRRWFFTNTRDCALGVIAYALASMVFVAYVTGADAIAGFLDGWFLWLVVATLAPWFSGFWVADRGRFRFRKRA